MVALVIGSVLIAGALAVFIDSRQTSRVNQIVARIQENGLFAADVISRSLELAGYWGENNNTNLVIGRTERTDGLVSTPSSLPSATDNCTSADGYQWYTDLERSVEGIDTDGSTDANDVSSYATCIPDTTYLQPGDDAFGASDILVVRYVDPNPATTLHADTVYVRSDPKQSRIFVGTTEPSGFGSAARSYELKAYAYYVSKFFEDPADGIPTLKRASLVAGTGSPRIVPGSSAEEEIVIPGVESFQVQYGIDTDGDGSANQYVNAGSVQAAQWNDVVAVRFWLVVRAEASEPHFQNTATYRLPQADVTPSDGFRRVRITRTVQVRNIERG